LLFFDDDDVMDANYVAAMAQALNEHPYVGGIDRYDVVNPEWLQARGNHDNKVEGGLVKSHYLPFVGGGMIGVRRTVFEAVGGFDERVLRPEDMDFAWRVKHLLGIKPRAVPNAQFYCRARSSLWGNAKQQYLLARGYYRVCWRHGQDQEVVGEEVGPYAYRWARKLLVELVRTVRGWGDMLFWIREAAWHAGLVREAWNLRSDINTISVDKSLPLPRRVAP
jgi:GT2 family glycosyltransferase